MKAPPHERLAAYLASAGITQAEFAKRIGTDPGNLSRLLRNKCAPSFDVALAIERETHEWAIAPREWKA